MDLERPVDGSATQVLVLGIGNMLLRDDGVGLRVLQALERAPDLLVIDALRMAEAPGSVRCFENEAMDRFLRGHSGSVHEIGLRDVLDMARLSGHAPRRRALVGVEPGAVELGEDLSPEVQRGVEPAVRAARDVLERWLADYPK
jgi:hydrogenase maturation protease